MFFKNNNSQEYFIKKIKNNFLKAKFALLS